MQYKIFTNANLLSEILDFLNPSYAAALMPVSRRVKATVLKSALRMWRYIDLDMSQHSFLFKKLAFFTKYIMQAQDSPRELLIDFDFYTSDKNKLTEGFINFLNQLSQKLEYIKKISFKVYNSDDNRPITISFQKFMHAFTKDNMLEYLEINGIHSSNLQYLQQLSHLKTLNLAFNGVGNTDFMLSLNSKCIENMDVSGANISSLMFYRFVKTRGKNIKKIVLNNSFTYDEYLYKALLELHQLKEVCIESDPHPFILKALTENNQNLEKISFKFSKFEGLKGSQFFKRHFPSLKTLHFDYCTRIDDASLIGLISRHALQLKEIKFYGFNPELSDKLSQVITGKCAKLEKLVMIGTNMFTHAAADSMLKEGCMSSLRSLEIKTFKQDEGLNNRLHMIANKFDNLRIVTL